MIGFNKMKTLSYCAIFKNRNEQTASICRMDDLLCVSQSNKLIIRNHTKAHQTGA
jgi:hypothetical protein